jgi:hypothetical protein
VCRDNILKTLVNLSYNIPIIYIPKFLKVFDNILKEPSHINVFMNNLETRKYRILGLLDKIAEWVCEYRH